VLAYITCWECHLLLGNLARHISDSECYILISKSVTGHVSFGRWLWYFIWLGAIKMYISHSSICQRRAALWVFSLDNDLVFLHWLLDNLAWQQEWNRVLFFSKQISRRACLPWQVVMAIFHLKWTYKTCQRRAALWVFSLDICFIFPWHEMQLFKN
jgi:hypothetical protein